jgi:hypothetical protein
MLRHAKSSWDDTAGIDANLAIGIFCDDVSEFESDMPSQPVRSLCAMSSTHSESVY